MNTKGLTSISSNSFSQLHYQPIITMRMKRNSIAQLNIRDNFLI